MSNKQKEIYFVGLIETINPVVKIAFSKETLGFIYPDSSVCVINGKPVSVPFKLAKVQGNGMNYRLFEDLRAALVFAKENAKSMIDFHRIHKERYRIAKAKIKNKIKDLDQKDETR
jgi:hypothetical protein